MWILNPPFELDEQAKAALPWLAKRLGNGKPGYVVDWLGEGDRRGEG